VHWKKKKLLFMPLCLIHETDYLNGCVMLHNIQSVSKVGKDETIASHGRRV